jgi:hypothetical protein
VATLQSNSYMPFPVCLGQTRDFQTFGLRLLWNTGSTTTRSDLIQKVQKDMRNKVVESCLFSVSPGPMNREVTQAASDGGEQVRCRAHPFDNAP